MKRSIIAFLFVSALSVMLAAAVYADTGTAAPQGWFQAQLVGEQAAQVAADAQKLIGVSADQMISEMGPTSLKSSDGSGGTNYFYEIHLATSPSGVNSADVWIDVDSSGKVSAVDVS
jgi:hypothetical protein